MKVWICLVLIASLCFSAPLKAQEDEPHNIRLNVLIEKSGYSKSLGSSSTVSEKTQQFITTIEGREATIFVGKRIPQFIPIRKYLVEHDYVDFAVQYAEVGTQLRAIPRIRRGMIEIEITPEISYQTADGQTQVIQIRKLSSTVLVRNGETIQLGSVVSDSEFVDLFYRNERGERLTFFLTPEMID